MTTRTCTVSSHIRKLPEKPSAFDSKVNQELRREFAISVMEREIERAVRIDIAALSLRAVRG